MSRDDTEAALAAEIPDDVDSLVLNDVGELYSRLDPPPPGLADQVKFELTLAALHAEIAQLEQLTSAVARHDEFTTTGSVTFTSSSLSLMVSVAAEPDGRTVRVDGWVTGGETGVELRVAARSFVVTADINGRFVLSGLPHGPARFVLRPTSADARPVITPTIEI
ncbi:MAG: hypothetical protein ACOYBY_05555 [Dermatophilaceae bacterium]